MSTQKALVMHGGSEATVVTDRSIPTLRDGYILVKVKAVALNPTDWKHIAKRNTPGALSGCDYAGVVEKTGKGYSKQWSVGDRICGLAHGGNSLQLEDGAFAEYIAVKADVQLRIPDAMSFEEAATLGVGYVTCGQGLFQFLGLNLPSEPTSHGETVFIYGGSTATGTLGIQYATLAGYTVITTCSPRNFALVKSLGAKEAFDYNDDDCVEKIQKFANGKLRLVWDTIGRPGSVEICSKVIAPGGHYNCLLPVKFPRTDVTHDFTVGYTVFGEPVDKDFFKREDNSKDFEFTKNFAVVTEKLLEQGKLKVHPAKVEHSGLDGVLNGLELLKADKVSGQKLVYTL